MFEQNKNPKEKIESIKPGDENLFLNPPKYSELLTALEKEAIGQEMEKYLKKRGLLGILQKAGSLDKTQDAILYR